MMRKDRSLFFWIFTFAVLVAVILPMLVQDGMFMDGMLYACVSKNLSHGIGSFWFPHYSPTLYPFFDQQPPLGFGIQSLFFSCFGDSMYTERLYSFLCAVTNAYLIAVLWRFFFRQEEETRKVSWLPVLLWITIPVCFWAFSNNMLENTMCIFDLLAMLFLARYLFKAQQVKYLLVAGIFIFLATFTKGIQGAFPLAAIFFGWLVYRQFSFAKMVVASLILLAVPVAIYFLLVQNNQVYTSLSTYLGHRVLNSIQNVSEVESRFYLAGRLFIELIPAMAFTTLILLVYRKKTGPLLQYKKHILFWVLVGISASFPLMVTLEQRGFYLVTSLPYFAMALAILAAPGLSRFVRTVNGNKTISKAFGVFSVLLLCGALIFSVLQVGKTSRDKEMLHDVYLIGQVVPQGTVLGSTRELWEDYSLQEYLVRYFYVCQAEWLFPESKFLVLTSAESAPNMRLEKVQIPTVKYHLYKRVEE